MHIAAWLDKNNVKYCWSELVNWVFGFHPTLSIFYDNSSYKSQGCRIDREGTPYAYCGKCENNRRYYLKQDI
jgi:hypothetical protein